MPLPSTRRRGGDRACLFLDAHAAPARRTPTSQGAAPFGRAPSVVCCWTGGWRLAPALSLNPLASQLQALVHWGVHQHTCTRWGGLYRSPTSGNRGGWRNMTTLAFVAGILLGGKAGVLLALYVRGMGGSALS